MSVRWALLGLALALGLAPGWPLAADVRVVETDYRGKRLLTMSTAQAATAGSMAPAATGVLSIEDRANLRRFVADTPEGKVHSDWYDVHGPEQWVVFDERERRFRALAPSLRVVADDYIELARVAAELGATETRVLEPLGHAIVRLRPDVDPTGVASALNGHPAVDRAEVRFVKLPLVPL